jgi:hypothetical protein
MSEGPAQLQRSQDARGLRPTRRRRPLRTLMNALSEQSRAQSSRITTLIAFFISASNPLCNRGGKRARGWMGMMNTHNESRPLEGCWGDVIDYRILMII